jgi:hypothetical protein
MEFEKVTSICAMTRSKTPELATSPVRRRIAQESGPHKT